MFKSIVERLDQLIDRNVPVLVPAPVVADFKREFLVERMVGE